MILTCPACSTRYLVNPAAFGPEGRMVRCAKCGHTWMQAPPEDLPKQVEAPPVEAEPRPLPPGSNLPAFRRPPVRRRGGALGWIALAAVVILIVGGGYFFRRQVVDIWPATAKLYVRLGLIEGSSVLGAASTPEVPGAGLELRNISLSRAREGGSSVLVVKGEIANPTSEVRSVPPLRGALMADGSREIRGWTFTAAQSRLLPGEVTTFRTTLSSPGSTATNISITFVAGTGTDSGTGTDTGTDSGTGTGAGTGTDSGTGTGVPRGAAAGGANSAPNSGSSGGPSGAPGGNTEAPPHPRD